jgi:hypothetical protein
MIRHFSICFCLSFITASIPSRAANKPYARTDGQTIKVWTNNDLAQLHSLGLISISLVKLTKRPQSRNPRLYRSR